MRSDTARPAAETDAARIAALELALREATDRAAAAEQRLRQLEAHPADVAAEIQRHELLYYMPTALAVHDAQGMLLACNQAFALLVQQPTAQLRGLPLGALLPHDQAPTWPAYLAQVTGEDTSAGWLPLQARDGQTRHLYYQAQRLGVPGPAARVLLCAFDGSAQVLAETRLRQAMEKAEASARAKETFLANLSHEIRTPMNGVLGMARQLTKTPLDTDQQELLRVIQASGEHLLFVLNEVLDMTKISSARLELEQRSFDLCDSVRAALHPLAIQATEKGIAFHATLLEYTGPLPRVVGDAFRLNQVLINLVSNAIKFTAPGGGISVGAYLLSRTETRLQALFRVNDTGIGIAEDKLEYIFEDFAQGHVDTARRFGGTGLGLGIARALVEQMGGELTVASQLGYGSTFSFSVSLPCAVDADSAPRPLLPDSSVLRNRRVLLVEDNDINRDVVRRLLQGWGVVVDEAPDGPSALALHAAHLYDAVLMDIQMPGMSGVEATAQLRLHPDPRRAQVPVLALTANAFRADLDRYLKAGINDCLTKPFKEEAFYYKLAALVQAARPPLYNLALLHELADGETAFVERLVQSFLQNIPPVLQQIQTAAGGQQWTQVARLVHHIKPNLIQFGIAGIAQAMELLLTPAEPGAGAGHTQAVQLLLRQVRQVLAELPAELPAEPE